MEVHRARARMHTRKMSLSFNAKRQSKNRCCEESVERRRTPEKTMLPAVVIAAAAGISFGACFRFLTVKSLRRDYQQLKYLEESVDDIKPLATRSEKEALDWEIKRMETELAKWFPLPLDRVQWEDLPMDGRYSSYLRWR
jgi:hypothetical protein